MSLIDRATDILGKHGVLSHPVGGEICALFEERDAASRRVPASFVGKKVGVIQGFDPKGKGVGVEGKLVEATEHYILVQELSQGQLVCIKHDNYMFLECKSDILSGAPPLILSR